MIDVMKSPFTGKDMTLVYDRRTWSFRGEQYEYTHAAWLCADTGETFTTDEMDDAGYVQVANQYRAKYGIPFTDEIISVREKYGLSAAKMSQILGFGVNQWRTYEAGEVPSVSNGRMIRSIMDPKVFLSYVSCARYVIGEKEYCKLSARISQMVDHDDRLDVSVYDHMRVFLVDRGLDNGFAQQSLGRLKNVLLYILERCGEVFCTKMNKLLFYVDFLAYRSYGAAVSGLSYRALPYGPVPERWDRVYSCFDEIVQEPRCYCDKEGSVLTSIVPADTSLFTAAELGVLDEVCARFGRSTSGDLTAISHQESAWNDYKDGGNRIPFDSAFDLKGI
jgi:uncharacterized phage-associated protein